jgi:hypothetical protein
MGEAKMYCVTAGADSVSFRRPILKFPSAKKKENFFDLVSCPGFGA